MVAKQGGASCSWVLAALGVEACGQQAAAFGGFGGGRAVAAADEGVGVAGRGLEAVPGGAGLPVPSVLSGGPALSLGSGGPGFPLRPGRACGSGCSVLPVAAGRSVLADAVGSGAAGLAGRSGRTGWPGRACRAGVALWSGRSGDALARLPAGAWRACDRLRAELLNLGGECVPCGVRCAEFFGEVLHGEERRSGKERSSDGEDVALPATQSRRSTVACHAVAPFTRAER